MSMIMATTMVGFIKATHQNQPNYNYSYLATRGVSLPRTRGQDPDRLTMFSLHTNNPDRLKVLPGWQKTIISHRRFHAFVEVSVRQFDSRVVISRFPPSFLATARNGCRRRALRPAARRPRASPAARGRPAPSPAPAQRRERPNEPALGPRRPVQARQMDPSARSDGPSPSTSSPRDRSVSMNAPPNAPPAKKQRASDDENEAASPPAPVASPAGENGALAPRESNEPASSQGQEDRGAGEEDGSNASDASSVTEESFMSWLMEQVGDFSVVDVGGFHVLELEVLTQRIPW